VQQVLTAQPVPLVRSAPRVLQALMESLARRERRVCPVQLEQREQLEFLAQQEQQGLLGMTVLQERQE
jgi:hypothetical protein